MPEDSPSLGQLPTAKVLLWSPKARGVECDIVTDFNPELEELVDHLTGTMYQHDGVGLAASQIGVFKKVAVIQLVEDRKRPPFIMVNPVIANSAGEQADTEGCLSLPGVAKARVRAKVKRGAIVKVTFQDITGKSESIECRDLMARAVQHEIDHLNGLFFIDRISSLQRDSVMRHYRYSMTRMKPEVLKSIYRQDVDVDGWFEPAEEVKREKVEMKPKMELETAQ